MLASVVLVLNMIIPIRLGNIGMVEYRIVKHLSSSGSIANPYYHGLVDDIVDLTQQSSSSSQLVQPPPPAPLPPPAPRTFSNKNQQTIVSIVAESTTTTTTNDNYTTMCHCYDDNDALLQSWHKVHLIIYSLAPFPLLCLLNFIVVRKTRDAAKSAVKINLSKNIGG